MRSVVIKALNLVGARTGWSLPARAETFWGQRMWIRIPEAVSNQLFSFGLFEPGLTAFMLQVLQPGHVVIDVGAHFGYFTLLAVHRVGEAGRVDAFEPMPSTFKMLERNAAARSNVILNCSAVWSQRSELIITDLGMHLSAFNSVFNPRLDKSVLQRERVREVRVQAISLDEYCQRKRIQPNFVKVDAESAEYQILAGMSRILTTARPFVTLEVGDFNLPDVPTSNELLEAVVMMNYIPFEYVNGTIRRHYARASYKYDNILLAPRESKFAKHFAGD